MNVLPEENVPNQSKVISGLYRGGGVGTAAKSEKWIFVFALQSGFKVLI